jgi:biopolymer transport protein ExbD
MMRFMMANRRRYSVFTRAGFGAGFPDTPPRTTDLEITRLLMLAVACVSCDFAAKQELPPGASADDEPFHGVQDVALPVSLRTRDVAPGDARAIEATDTVLRVDGEQLLTLDKGRVAAADRPNYILPKLEARLQTPARAELALRLQANLPYETVALILNTARKVGMSHASFQVRRVGDTAQTGFISFREFVMSSKADDLPPITAAAARRWNDFTDKWQPIFDGCRSAESGDCAYVNDNVASGGTLKLELMASGRGLNVDFFRRGLTPAQEAKEEKKLARQLAAKKEKFLQGHLSHEDMVEALLLGDPSTYALFQFRYQEALKPQSALSKTLAPICHDERCAVVVTADPITPLVNVLSMVGAAFPDGTAGPAVAFEMPWTERPKPAVLSEWIAQQSARQ